MNVPAFAWPPGFFNQAVKGFVYCDGNTGAILTRTPIITGLTKNGVGDYTIDYEYRRLPYGTNALIQVVGSTPLSNSYTITLGHLRVYLLDAAGNPADSFFNALLFTNRRSWI